MPTPASQAKVEAKPRLGLLSRLPLTKLDGTPALTARYRSPRELTSPSYAEFAPEGGLELRGLPSSAPVANAPLPLALPPSDHVVPLPTTGLSEQSQLYAELSKKSTKPSTACCAPATVVTAWRILSEGVLHAMPAILLTCFLLLPAVSNRVFRSFACRGFTLDDTDLIKWCAAATQKGLERRLTKPPEARRPAPRAGTISTAISACAARPATTCPRCTTPSSGRPPS